MTFKFSPTSGPSDKNTLIVAKMMTDSEIESKAGHFFDRSHYLRVLDNDVDIYDENGDLIAALRKNVIPAELSVLGSKSFLKYSKKMKSTNRGMASGLVDLSKFSKNAVELLDEGKVKSRIKFKDGRVSTYKLCNSSNSIVAGYINGKALSDYKKPNQIQSEPTKGRLTAFSKNQPEAWDQFLPLLDYVNNLFLDICPEQYQLQNQELEDCPYRIGDSIFTTVTVNYNFRTACHKDKGNLKNSVSAFIVCENR